MLLTDYSYDWNFLKVTSKPEILYSLINFEKSYLLSITFYRSKYGYFHLKDYLKGMEVKVKLWKHK